MHTLKSKVQLVFSLVCIVVPKFFKVSYFDGLEKRKYLVRSTKLNLKLWDLKV